MGRSEGYPRLALLATVGFVACACSDKDPCPGVVNQATYRVDVQGQASSMLVSDCYLDWGLSDGFTARVARLKGDGSCLVGVPELEGIAGWSLTDRDPEVTSEGFLEGAYRELVRFSV